jgi:DNA-binding transcriptional regulator GbsR (MarR family)
LTDHAIVLLLVAEQPDMRIAEIAERTGISTRAVQMVLRDLVDEGYAQRRRVGRRNVYTVPPDSPLPRLPQARVSDLLTLAGLDPPAAP